MEKENKTLSIERYEDIDCLHINKIITAVATCKVILHVVHPQGA